MNEINKEISQLWQEALEAKQIKVAREPNIQKLINEGEKKSYGDATKQLEPWISILDEGIHLLAQLHIALDLASTGDFEKDKYIKIPNALIGTACAHTVAIRRLVLSGLDCSAKVVLRSLMETLGICIAVIKEHSIANNYHSAQDFKQAKEFWFKTISRKKLKTILSSVEIEVGFDNATIEELKKWREEEFSFLSQYVHPSYIAACFSSWPCSIKKPYHHISGILGAASILSERTLTFACRSIWYFSRLGILLLMKMAENVGSPVWHAFQGENGATVIIGREIYSKIILRYWDRDKNPYLFEVNS